MYEDVQIYRKKFYVDLHVGDSPRGNERVALGDIADYVDSRMLVGSQKSSEYQIESMIHRYTEGNPEEVAGWVDHLFGVDLKEVGEELIDGDYPWHDVLNWVTFEATCEKEPIEYDEKHQQALVKLVTEECVSPEDLFDLAEFEEIDRVDDLREFVEGFKDQHSSDDE